MKKILVLLSAYNGEKYIDQQIISILEQKEVELWLIIRDDGSKDNTIEEIERISLHHNNITLIKGENVGFIKSFSQLILEANKHKDYDYFAFADQDDIWHPNKLKVAISKLEEFDDSTPNMFASNCNLVDSNGLFLKTLRNYSLNYKIGNVLYGACLQGCSMVFNKKAVELYASHPTENTYHDVWMLYICVYFGHFIYYKKPLFNYRIHENNAIGISRPPQTGLINKINNSIHGRRDTIRMEAAKEFNYKFQGILTPFANKVLYDYINYPVLLKCKINLLFNSVFCYPKSGINNKIKNKIDIILNKL